MERLLEKLMPWRIVRDGYKNWITVVVLNSVNASTIVFSITAGILGAFRLLG